MKTSLTTLSLVALLCCSVLAPPVAQGRTITELKVIPTRVLQRSVSPKFYASLIKSPIQGWTVVRAQLSGTRLSGPRVIRSGLQGLYDPLALQLAKEAVMAGNYTIDRPNVPSSVLLHVLVYQIADGTMVLSFAHLDEAGGDQAEYWGCARLLVLKADKWTEIKGPESLAGKGWAMRRGMKNNLDANLKLEQRMGAETVNMEQHRYEHHY